MLSRPYTDFLPGKIFTATKRIAGRLMASHKLPAAPSSLLVHAG